MRYALLLRINDRTYPVKYETARDLNRVINEVVPNGITVRLGRASDGNMVIGIVSYDKTKVNMFGLVNYKSPIFNDKTTPRWIPDQKVRSQKIVNGLIEEGDFELDPLVPTKVPFDADYNPQTWTAKPSGYTVTPNMETDLVYLPNDPATRAWGFKFKTPKPYVWVEETGLPQDWYRFSFPYTIPAGGAIYDMGFNLIEPQAANRYDLKLDTEYFVVIRSSTAAIDDTPKPAAITFMPVLEPIAGTKMVWDVENWSDLAPNDVTPSTVDMTPGYIGRRITNGKIAGTFTVRFTPTKDELNRFTFGGWFGALRSLVDTSSPDPIQTRVIGNNTFYQLLKDHTYEMNINVGGVTWLDYHIDYQTGFTKYFAQPRPMVTDQPLELRKTAFWNDSSDGNGHAQVFPSLTAERRLEGYKGLIFGMTMVPGGYNVHTGWSYYPFLFSLYEMDDVLAHIAGGPLPVPIATGTHGSAASAQPITSWDNNENIVIGKQYVVEVSTRNAWTRMEMSVYPKIANGKTTALKPSRVNVNATLAESLKQIQLPLRINNIRTINR